MEKTAVEVLIEKYNNQWGKYGMGSVISYSELISDLKKAKEMEKEQIIDAFEQGEYTSRGFEDLTSEEYYNINFKSE